MNELKENLLCACAGLTLLLVAYNTYMGCCERADSKRNSMKMRMTVAERMHGMEKRYGKAKVEGTREQNETRERRRGMMQRRTK